MALARYAPNRANAQQLMEFLVGKWAQEYYASTNNEFSDRRRDTGCAIFGRSVWCV